MCKVFITFYFWQKKRPPAFADGRIILRDLMGRFVAFLTAVVLPFDGMLGSKETDAENCSCVSVSDKEFARLHSKFGLKKEDVLETIKAYAQELGLEYSPVNYFMMCDPKYANDLGEIVQ